MEQSNQRNRSLNMKGPYILSDEEVDKRVERGKMGNYAYGYVERKDGKGIFIVRYVGRSTTDLQTEIKERHKKDPKFSQEDCKSFKFSYASSEKEAYEKECINFHDFGGCASLLNEVHPAKPQDGEQYHCPVVGCDR